MRKKDYEEIRKITDKKSVNEIIYPGEIAKTTKLPLEEVYSCLLEDEDLDSILEAYCDNCGKLSGLFFNTFWEVPEKVFCPFCKQEIPNAAGDSVVVFRKNPKPFEKSKNKTLF